MDLEKYKQELALLTEKFEKEKFELAIMYANNNKRFNKGDILKNHYVTILVDKLSVRRSISGIPYIIYEGFELKKDLTPKKNGNRESLHDSDSDDSIVLLNPKA